MPSQDLDVAYDNCRQLPGWETQDLLAKWWETHISSNVLHGLTRIGRYHYVNVGWMKWNNARAHSCDLVWKQVLQQ